MMTTRDLVTLYENQGLTHDAAVRAACGEGGKVAAGQKYHARRKEIDGHVFDSTREARRYQELRVMELSGAITGLKLQPRFLLQEGFRGVSGKWYRPTEYVADFEYQQEGRRVVEDVKGMRLPVYMLKLKLFAAKYPDIEFREIR